MAKKKGWKKKGKSRPNRGKRRRLKSKGRRPDRVEDQTEAEQVIEAVNNSPKFMFTNHQREVKLPHAMRNRDGDAPAIEEIRRVYDYIRMNPGLRKAEIMRASRKMGIRRQRLEQRWQSIRVYLRAENADATLDCRRSNGQAWVEGRCDNPYGRFMRYYATNPKAKFTLPTNVGELYDVVATEEPKKYTSGLPRWGNITPEYVDDELFTVEDELPPAGDFTESDIEPLIENDIEVIEEEDPEPSEETIVEWEELDAEDEEDEEVPVDVDPEWATVIYRGVKIRVKAGSVIRLD